MYTMNLLLPYNYRLGFISIIMFAMFPDYSSSRIFSFLLFL